MKGYRRQEKESSARQLINGCLDRLVRPTVHVLGRSWNAYLFWQGLGIALGTLAVLAIAFLQELSLNVAAGMQFLSVLMVILLYRSVVIFGNLLRGVEIFGKPYPLLLIWAGSGIYHFQVAIIASAALFLWLIREPILTYLDILVVGLAVAQMSGRVGCWMVGCCHGRPHRWGACYGNEHLEAGYVSYLQGVRLLPVQLLESLWLLFLIIVAILFILSGRGSGEVLSWYVLGYGAGRIFLEFLRADTIRLYFGGFSEAQWTALLLTSTTVCLELAGVLTFHWWHVGLAILPISVAVVVSLGRHFKRAEKYELLHPYHFREFAEAVSWVFDVVNEGIATTQLSELPASTIEAVTSLNVQLSAMRSDSQNGCTYRYSISYQDGIMKKEIARMLAGFIVQLKHPSEPQELIESGRGVFSLFIQKSTSPDMKLAVIA